MAKLIVNRPDGAQVLINVEGNGGYYDDTKVVYDSRFDTDPFDPTKVGGYSKDGGGNLVFDQGAKDASDAILQAIIDDEAQKASDEAARVSRLVNAKAKPTMTTIELTQAVQDIIAHLKV